MGRYEFYRTPVSDGKGFILHNLQPYKAIRGHDRLTRFRFNPVASRPLDLFIASVGRGTDGQVDINPVPGQH